MQLNWKHKIILRNLLLALGVIIVFLIFFKYLFGFVAPFVIGWLLSLLFLPLVNLLEEKCRVPRWIGSLCTILLLFLFLGIVGAGVWNKLYTEATMFYSNLPVYVASLQESLDKATVLIDKVKDAIPGNLQSHTGLLRNFFSGIVPSVLQSGGNHSVNALKAIPNVVMILIVSFISSYFFAKDKYQVSALVRRYLPKDLAEKYDVTMKELKTSISGYFKTQGILMFYTFAICIIGLLILRSPYALLLSVVTSIIDAIPFFGSGFILWPGALIYLLTGKTGMAVGYIVIYVCVNMMRQVMQPKILGTQIGLHPLLTLFSMYIGLKCLGIFGMILGPIVAVVVKAVCRVTEVERRLHEPKENEK